MTNRMFGRVTRTNQHKASSQAFDNPGTQLGFGMAEEVPAQPAALGLTVDTCLIPLTIEEIPASLIANMKLLDVTSKFDGSVGALKRAVESGQAKLPKDGVCICSKRLSQSKGEKIFFMVKQSQMQYHQRMISGIQTIGKISYQGIFFNFLFVFVLVHNSLTPLSSQTCSRPQQQKKRLVNSCKYGLCVRQYHFCLLFFVFVLLFVLVSFFSSKSTTSHFLLAFCFLFFFSLFFAARNPRDH